MNRTLSTLEEYRLKKEDARLRLRLSKAFAVFIKTPGGARFFVSGGNTEPKFSLQYNFVALIIGASVPEVQELSNVLSDAASRFRSRFSNEDFYSAAAADVLGNYLRTVLEDIEIPQGLAAEIMIIDQDDKLITMSCSGDSKDVDLTVTNKIFFAIGEEKLKKEVLMELEGFFKFGGISVKKLSKFTRYIRQKMKLAYASFNPLG